MPTPDAHRSSWGVDVTATWARWGSSGWGRSARRWRRGWSTGRAGCTCTTCGRRPRSRSWRAGAVLAGSAAELGAACDLVSVMVLDDEQVRAVVGGAADDGATGHRHRGALHDPARDRRGAGGDRVRAGHRPARRPGERRVHGGARGHAGRDGGRRPDRLRAGQARVRLLGQPRRAHGPGRRGHAHQARPQPHALHRVHRRGRGPAPGRGGGARPPEARPRGAAQRLGDRRSGGDHGPRHDGAPGAGRRPPRDLHPHPRAWERRTSRSPSSWPRPSVSTSRSPARPSRTSARASGSRVSRRGPRSRRRTWRGCRAA